MDALTKELDELARHFTRDFAKPVKAPSPIQRQELLAGSLPSVFTPDATSPVVDSKLLSSDLCISASSSVIANPSTSPIRSLRSLSLSRAPSSWTSRPTSRPIPIPSVARMDTFGETTVPGALWRRGVGRMNVQRTLTDESVRTAATTSSGLADVDSQSSRSESSSIHRPVPVQAAGKGSSSHAVHAALPQSGFSGSTTSTDVSSGWNYQPLIIENSTKPPKTRHAR